MTKCPWVHALLPRAGRATLRDSRLDEVGPWHPQPRSRHLFSQSNYASMNGVSFDLLHPLNRSEQSQDRASRCTDVEFISPIVLAKRIGFTSYSSYTLYNRSF